MIRVTHVLPRAITDASGPTYTVSTLCRSLTKRGLTATLACLGAPTETARACNSLIFDRPRSQLAWRLGWSSEMKLALQSAEHRADVFHGHSLWMMPNIYVADAARAHRSPLVLSPRGTLSAWALRRSKWRKRAIWIYGQKRAFRSTTCAVATCHEERDDLRRFGYTGPIAVIPNGVTIPALEPPTTQIDPSRTVAFLSRIHPKKGLDQLLSAWESLASDHPGWSLRIVGPLDSAYADGIRHLSSKLPRVEVKGALFQAEKTEFLARSDVLVLPSHSENFGMVVAESLAAGTPVIASRGTPWSALVTKGCGWWTPNDPQSLEQALRHAMALDRVSLKRMGQLGRKWMAAEFGWDMIARQHRTLYEWLLGGNRPSDFEVDGDLLATRR